MISISGADALSVALLWLSLMLQLGVHVHLLETGRGRDENSTRLFSPESPWFGRRPRMRRDPSGREKRFQQDGKKSLVTPVVHS